MIKAVLLDLDNTLLVNPDHVFAPAYLQLAEEYFQKAWGYSGFAQVLLGTMRVMTGVRDMRRTNTAVALDYVQTAVQRLPEALQADLAAFYQEAYPALASCTQRVEGALRLIEYLQKQDYACVIATNPLYPAEAIRQRLDWAGLPDDFSQYAFVTHSDNMHFTKPDPAYYAEILARVGIEPDEAIMVGDSVGNDIAPAATIGLHTFHIGADDAAKGGTLLDFMVHMQNQEWLNNLLPALLRPFVIAPQFRGNVGALFGLLDNIRPSYWGQHPDPNEWSPLQIVCHLLDSEQTVQRPRLELILAQDNPFLAEPRQPEGPEAPDCDDDGMRVAVKFLQARQATLDFLQTLSDEDWNRPARHSIFGPTTLLEMAHFTAQHDRLHLTQLCRTLGNCQ
ncbi:MAG: HAD-IA family hydrolase [bacterium]|nr:HAD-IA family hydrolase [bacterium]